MSHQDTRVREERLNGECLKDALQWLFAKMDWSGIQFRKDCLWAPAILASMATLFLWSGETTLTDRFDRALRVAESLFPDRIQQGRRKKRKGKKRKPAVSYQSFMKLLRRWTPHFVSLILDEFRRRLPELFNDCLLIYGYPVYGCDGSRVDLPRTHSNEGAYAPSRKQTRGKKPRKRSRKSKSSKPSRKNDVPQMWLTLMFHVGTELPWDWRIGPSDSSERAHMLEMLAKLPPNALVTADAGFVGYEYLSAIHGSGRSLLIRVGSNVRLLKKLGVFREAHNRVYLWPERKTHEKPLVLRLVVADNGKHPVYLVTNVLSERRLSDAQVVTIYAKRWRLEVHYRHFKQTYAKRKLRSHNSENARVELDWSLLGLSAMLLYTLVEIRKTGADPEKLSCAAAWREIRNTMNDYLHVAQPGERLRQRLQAAVTDDYLRRDKTSRDYCRKKKEKPAGAPIITNATAAQIKRAKTICSETAPKRVTA
jgi:Transposase DDE domain